MEHMVAPVVIAAAGLGMLAGVAGVATANRTTGDGLPAAYRWNARPRCSTCRGTGREECLCSRWSDGDVGCGTCSGSGRKRCRSCGGSGTGRQLPARLIVQQQKLPNAHGRRGDHN
uniref:Drought-induced protein 1 n=1 Tax=Aegilops tauschii TaxID=37682 RepID=M8BLZ4_AEGTA